MVVSINPDLYLHNSQTLMLAFIEPTQITYLFWISLFEQDQYGVTGHFLKLDQSLWQRKWEEKIEQVLSYMLELLLGSTQHPHRCKE